MSGNFIDVAILGREYRVACPPGEQEALLAAVAYVDRKMQDIAAKSKTAAAERVAVMAALNIAHELLSAAVGENHEFILRMLMQGQNELRISNMAAQGCHFVRNLSF